MRRSVWAAAAFAAAALASSRASPAGFFADPPDAAMPPDAAAPIAREGPCGPLEAKVDRRKAWLEARRREQFLTGPADPKKGIPNAVALFCERSPADPDCLLGSTVVEVGTEDLVWVPDAGFDDYEAHVLGMRRELARCREQALKAAKGR